MGYGWKRGAERVDFHKSGNVFVVSLNGCFVLRDYDSRIHGGEMTIMERNV